MSRIGKQIISIPEKTEVKKEGGTVVVKGPLGELSRTLPLDVIDVVIEGGNVSFVPKESTPFARALWGTVASHVKNMVEGVNKPYEKELVVEGVGYKVEMKGKEIVLSLGFSHTVSVPVPEEISVSVEKNTIKISGIDKEKVGAFAAKVRSLKKPEPYKGKGIRYADEVVRRKQGKKSV